MKKHQRRSDCPISFALETFGDTWSLLIVRDIVYFGKKTYGEFLESDEGIATNILASRLEQLEQSGILTKRPYASDKRKEVYSLTEKGLDLIPILVEMASWSAQPRSKNRRAPGLDCPGERRQRQHDPPHPRNSAARAVPFLSGRTAW